MATAGDRLPSSGPAVRVGDKAWLADGVPDLFYGFAWLFTALFFFVWGAFVPALALAFLLLGGGRGFLQTAIAAAKAGLADRESGAVRRALRLLPPWRTAGFLAFLALFVALAWVRVSQPGGPDVAGDAPSTLARWWPALLTVPIPLMFVASWRQLGLPRHLVVGLVSLAGALAGPLLGLLWRDSLALAAAVLGAALVTAGALALRAFLRRRPRPAAG